jgi:hypothetical protein
MPNANAECRSSGSVLTSWELATGNWQLETGYWQLIVE